jgi:hypothetical protein
VCASQMCRFPKRHLQFFNIILSLSLLLIPRMLNAEAVAIIDEDSRFIAYNNGVVKDKKTGLEWIAGPDADTSWYTAKAWVLKLTVEDAGWRIPALKELKTLYQKGVGPRNMTQFLKTGGWLIWSGETKDSSLACHFNFISGQENWYTHSIYQGRRVFAVRSRIE